MDLQGAYGEKQSEGIYRDFPQLFAWTIDNNYLWSKVIEGLGTMK